MRIDGHAHAMHAEMGPEGRRVPPLVSPWREPGFTTEELLARSGGVLMREYPSDVEPISAEAHIAAHRARGIERVVLLDPPDVTFEIHRIFGDFVLPCPQIRLDETTPADIDAILDRGAIGIKFIAPMHPYGSDCYLPIYRAVRDRNALATFHTGYLAHHFFDPGGVLPRSSQININHMRPSEIDRISRALPELKIVIAHFGNPWWDETHALISNNKNTYADFSGGSAYRRSLAFWKELLLLMENSTCALPPSFVMEPTDGCSTWVFSKMAHCRSFMTDFTTCWIFRAICGGSLTARTCSGWSIRYKSNVG